MNKKQRVAIVGYGNVGRYAVAALQSTPDMELVGVVRRQAAEPQPAELRDIRVVANVQELGEVDTALLCVPTRSVPEFAKALLQQGIHTVDSYDIHGQLADVRNDLDAVAKQAGSVAVISSGWDPGTDSMLRAMFEVMAPRGVTYTNFGPGMSMGHTVAAKAIDGVKKALSVTVPAGMGTHRRAVYVELQDRADFSQVEAAIKQDPYFVNDDTRVFHVDDVDALIDMGHGVVIERKGGVGDTHNQQFRYEMRVSNPALTSQVMVAAARSTMRQQPGCYTMLEIPIIDFMPGNRDDIIRRLV